jgi:hypothetical protein
MKETYSVNRRHFPKYLSDPFAVPLLLSDTHKVFLCSSQTHLQFFAKNYNFLARLLAQTNCILASNLSINYNITLNFFAKKHVKKLQVPKKCRKYRTMTLMSKFRISLKRASLKPKKCKFLFDLTSVWP